MAELPAVLAVDGGNSKADLALLDERGETIVAVRRPSISHQTVGPKDAASRLRAAADELRQFAGLPHGGHLARVAAFCLAGADLPSDDELLTTMLTELDLAPRWTLRNDVFAILRAGTDGVGVAVVCGAGMNAVGIAADGRSVRYPALGEVSGDLAAGGRWLGARALAMAIRGEDGRGASTALTEVVPAHFGLEHPLEVTEALYEGRLDDAHLVELAPDVLRTAAEGDEVASGLVDDIATEILATVRATLARLDLLRSAVPVVLGGGLFRSTGGLLQQRVTRGLAAFAPDVEVRVLTHHPVVGAALFGFDDLGITEPDVRERVARTLDAAVAAD